jgi:hypothetical protein
MPQYVTTKFGLMTKNNYNQLNSLHKKMIKNLQNELKEKKSFYELHKAMTQGASNIHQPHHGKYRFEINNLQRRLNALKNVLK